MIQVTVTVFSKDRAMQLEALMDSINAYARNLWLVGYACVLCECSDDTNAMAYAKIGKGHHGSYFWYYQYPTIKFKELLLHILTYHRQEDTALICDDDLLYRPLPDFGQLAPGEAYAPRLGKNCTYCYMADKPMKEGELDFAYPFSLDGNIYRTEDLLPHLQAAEYSNPNELEAALQDRFRPRLRYAEHSCLVGIPHNSVGSNKSNRNMGGSAEELNEMFLDGWRIDLDAMHAAGDFDNIRSVHAEIPYRFYKP